MRLYAHCLALLLLLFPSVGTAQIKVALSVTERTGGLFESAFRSALSRLSGVLVVQTSETPQYVLNMVVLCLPDGDECDDATSYAVSMYVTEPMTRRFSDAVADLGAASAPSGAVATKAGRDKVWDYIGNYVLVHEAWVATRGRSRYEEAVREDVAELDTRCFEKQRMIERWVRLDAAKDTKAADLLWADIFRSGRRWTC